MSSYCIINPQNKTIDYYSSISLTYKYLMEGLFDMSSIKEVGNIDPLLDELRYRGVLLFNVKQITKPQSYKVVTKVGASTLSFDSIMEAVEYCKKAKLSSAADSYIKNTLTKNLMGKTKSAYGLSWSFEITNLDISNYKINVII